VGTAWYAGFMKKARNTLVHREVMAEKEAMCMSLVREISGYLRDIKAGLSLWLRMDRTACDRVCTAKMVPIYMSTCL
jgi:hypothetical protein